MLSRRTETAVIGIAVIGILERCSRTPDGSSLSGSNLWGGGIVKVLADCGLVRIRIIDNHARRGVTTPKGALVLDAMRRLQCEREERQKRHIFH